MPTSRRASLITSQIDTAPKLGREDERPATRLITSQIDTAPKRFTNNRKKPACLITSQIDTAPKHAHSDDAGDEV